jgi:flagellar capping protein FliD
MGSDLRLTGLASGMDWQPIVEKLLELEAIPKQRLESQKKENEAKVSDLGLLKSQLDALRSASTSLQDDSLYNARSVQFSGQNSGLTATASTGALTGRFEIKVESLATSTEISSKNRTSKRLSNSLNLDDKLSDLPLHASLTTGTFTVSGRTFNISSLDTTLRELLVQINDVDPEDDGNVITFSYDDIEDKLSIATGINDSDQDSSNLVVLGSSTDTSNFLSAFKLIGQPSAGTVSSNNSLGSIDMTVSLANANFASAFSGLTSGMGNFFIGEGEGAVRIDYDANNDSLASVINKVNNSQANVFMYYDPVGDRFVVRNERAGSVGIVMHESENWDSISSANRGSGNLLELMGLAAPKVISEVYDPANLVDYKKGDFVQKTDGGITTTWQALIDSPDEDPSAGSEKWLQVISGVGRSMATEVGVNSSVRVNGGDLLYNTGTLFSEGNHGYEGVSFDIAQVSIGASITFTVSKDTSAVKKAVDKFVEEFNDAQDYIAGLTKVSQDGDDVSSSRFTGNQEINRLSSGLRRTFFGGSTPHSESGTTVDSSNLTVSTNNASNDEINAIATQLGLDASDDGYVIKVLNQSPDNQVAYFEWDGSAWSSTTPFFSTFRMTNIGLDFGIGSNNIKVVNSSLLAEELEKNPERVQALFSETLVEDAYDSITETNRDYQGVTYALNDYIDNFLEGDTSTGYKGAYQAFLDTIESQNERIDEKIVNLDKYLESREKILSEGFMRMEEMQSKMDSQMQTLQNTFNNNNKK